MNKNIQTFIFSSLKKLQINDLKLEFSINNNSLYIIINDFLVSEANRGNQTESIRVEYNSEENTVEIKYIVGLLPLKIADREIIKEDSLYSKKFTKEEDEDEGFFINDLKSYILSILGKLFSEYEGQKKNPYERLYYKVYCSKVLRLEMLKLEIEFNTLHKEIEKQLIAKKEEEGYSRFAKVVKKNPLGVKKYYINRSYLSYYSDGKPYVNFEMGRLRANGDINSNIMTTDNYNFSYDSFSSYFGVGDLFEFDSLTETSSKTHMTKGRDVNDYQLISVHQKEKFAKSVKNYSKEITTYELMGKEIPSGFCSTLIRYNFWHDYSNMTIKRSLEAEGLNFGWTVSFIEFEYKKQVYVYFNAKGNNSSFRVTKNNIKKLAEMVKNGHPEIIEVSNKLGDFQYTSGSDSTTMKNIAIRLKKILLVD